MLYRILLAGAVAAGTASQASAVELDTVVVSSGDDSSLADVAQPVLVLDQQALAKNPGDTLGTLLEQQPGISNASFGPGVGRPVLRGMSGSRVKMMINGHDSADLSAMSSDHAPMAEVANASQVEVIQGPATLLFGGGAIGGVVNVIDNKIARKPVTETDGQVSAKFDSNASTRQLSAELNGGNGEFAWHVSGFDKSTDDYQAADSETVNNSDTSGKGFSLGVSHTAAEKGFIGFSVSQSEYDYGVPNENDEQTRVRPEQIRYDLKSSWLNPFSGIISWDNEVSFNDYEHDELTEPTVEGLFDQETWEYNSRLRHDTLFGWQGHLGLHLSQQVMQLCHDHSGCSKIPDYSSQSWNGYKGGAFTERGGFEFVHNTPMPETETTDIGYFLVEKRDWQNESFGNGNFELGARIDFRTITSDPKTIAASSRQDESYYDDKYFAPLTLSFASTWNISPQQRWAISVARAQRAPDAQEMFWNGDHHATFSYQLDNPELKEETAYTFDINWTYASEQLFTRVSAYRYQFDDYIYNDLKSVKDPYHGNAVYRYEQADAEFYGGEVTSEYALTEQWHVLVQADYVSAQLTKAAAGTSNKNLPRTPPATALLQFGWHHNQWQAEIENRWSLAQNKTAAEESAAAAYQHVNARVNYSVMLATSYEWQLGLQLTNLFDAPGRNHVSYLKQFAPLPGRNISLSTSIQF
jgi:iron complex outermembrane receptor protein